MIFHRGGDEALYSLNGDALEASIEAAPSSYGNVLVHVWNWAADEGKIHLRLTTCITCDGIIMALRCCGGRRYSLSFRLSKIYYSLIYYRISQLD